MRLLHFSIALMFFLNLAFAEEFSIEEETLAPLPKPVLAAISAPKNFEFPKCTLVGKAVNLNDRDTVSDYIVTTSKACGWGAAAGPVWVVVKVNGSYNVVLQTTT